MNTKLVIFWNRLPVYLLGVLTFLLPIIFVPFQYLDFLTTKAGLFLILLTLSLFVWSINALKANKFELPFNWLSLVMVLIPVTYFISAFFSGNLNI